MWIGALYCAVIVVFIVYSLGVFTLGMKFRDKVLAEEQQIKLKFDNTKRKL